MIEGRLFPIDLLDKSIEERKNYFENKKVNHIKLQNATQQVINAIKNPGGFNIVMVVGPSGVGKSTVLEKVKQLMISEFISSEFFNEAEIPIASMVCPSPETGNFNWKDYYVKALKALNEPMIDKKINYKKIINNNQAEGEYLSNKKETALELRYSLENAFDKRNTVAFMIDEAQHLSKMASGRKLQDQLDMIKFIASTSNVPHILFGTYELLEFIDLNAQLSRRAIEIHLPRYKFENKEDQHEFKQAIHTFQKQIPLENEPDLLTNWEFIYDMSVGCIGIVKDWLVRCLSYALVKNLKTIDMEILKYHAFSSRKIYQIAVETVEGEAFFENDEEKLLKLRSILSTGSKSICYEESSANNRQSKCNNSVGKRNPTRDKVGK
jgi:shikimate kinase